MCMLPIGVIGLNDDYGDCGISYRYLQHRRILILLDRATLRLMRPVSRQADQSWLVDRKISLSVQIERNIVR